MRLLAAVERFLERAFERTSVRLFRAPLQPIQLERRLLHALELGRVVGPDGPMAPDRYRVAVNPSDLAGLGAEPADVARALADAALGLARKRGYRVADRPRIELVASEHVAPGDVRVDTGFSRRPGRFGVGEAAAARSAERSAVEATGVLARRPAPAVGVRLVLTTAGGRRREFALDGRPVTIGRAADNVIRIDDRRVSRHHARIVTREGGLVLVDLGSTNGTWVGGLRISEIALGVGDRIEIGRGAAELRLEATPDPGTGPPDPGTGPRDRGTGPRDRGTGPDEVDVDPGRLGSDPGGPGGAPARTWGTGDVPDRTTKASRGGPPRNGRPELEGGR
jgi:hypothetical protein